MEEEKSTAKLDFIRSIEKRVQKQWEEAKVYESDPLEQMPEEGKFFGNFPYPYMNGRLHLGHVFAFSKCEFYVRFQRMQGKQTFLPFGFHCTGMPIQASADKLKYELETYGNPPVFPETPVEEPGPKGVNVEEVFESSDPAEKKKGGTKSKTLMKTGGIKSQWKILESMGVPAEEIAKFADPVYWLNYFPALGIQDLKNWGACVDWRRSFITTDVNPYYDSFVRWQYNTLKAQDRFTFGKRFAIWAPKEGQQCADHERSSGEGVLPQDYTLIKMKVLEVPSSIKEAVGDRTLYFVAGTMRPETMYGQTNCWVKPDGDYGVFETVDPKALYVCSDRSARNMSFQDQTVEFGKHVEVARINGSDLIGTPLSSPQCTYDRIYALPMESILMTKATGVVTSVPSDSPDDWQNLQDLKNDPELRAKYGVKDEWIMPFEPISIIKVPELGELAAPLACKNEGVKSRSDKVALKKAKDIVYRLGFHSGVMLQGKYKDQTVEVAKPLVRADLIASGEAAAYSEPAEPVFSRSNEECVVALTNQWSITYGDPKWRDPVLEHVKEPDFQTFSEECRKNLVRCLEWMQPWAISRTYGLGTKVPWDEQYLIESLSDSTIYMAYYTIVPYLHSDLYGKQIGSGNIKPEQMTHNVWDHIFLDKPLEATDIDASVLQKMKSEFNYWYPWDMRCSGRDLLQNHLTMTLYHHAAIFPKKQWPGGIRATGFMMLNEKKMSKSTGNFLTLSEATEKFGCDAMRLNLARGGDQMTDGNFSEHEAEQSIMTLYQLVTWAQEILKSQDKLRVGDFNFFDRLIEDHMNTALVEAKKEFQNSMFRAGIEAGFNFLLINWKNYLSSVGEIGLDIGPHKDLVTKYVSNMAVLLAPVCPHLAEELWSISGGKGFVVNVRWPEAQVSNSKQLIGKEKYFEDVCKEIRRLHGLKKEEMESVRVFISSGPPEWQQKLVEIVNSDKALDFGACMKQVSQNKDIQKGAGKAGKKIFPNLIKQAIAARDGAGAAKEESFDELEFLTPLQGLISKKTNLKVELYLQGAEGAPATKAKVQPQKPGLEFIKKA